MSAPVTIDRALTMSLDDVIKETRASRSKSRRLPQSERSSLPKRHKPASSSSSSGMAFVTTKGGGLSRAAKTPLDRRANRALQRLQTRTRTVPYHQRDGRKAVTNGATAGVASTSARLEGPRRGAAEHRGLDGRFRADPAMVDRTSSRRYFGASPSTTFTTPRTSVVPTPPVPLGEPPSYDADGELCTAGDKKNDYEAARKGKRRISFLKDGPACTIRVGGLHPQALEEQIQSVLSQFGVVTHIQMEYDSYKRFVGVVYVGFSTEAAGSRAVAKLDGTNVDGNRITAEVIESPSAS